MIFHIFFSIVYFSFIFIRIVYHRKAKQSRGVVDYKENIINIAIRAFFGLGYISALIIYVFYPALLAWASFVLPEWSRWVGAISAVLSVGMIWWVQWALDIQFDTTLHIQADHQFITHGPYRWVRHPMYTSLLFMGISWLLLTTNMFIGGALLAGILIIITTRVGKEETALIDKFSDSYRTYMQNTGRYLPTWSARNHP
jgi:protein-S-isoprenylcysteine O-methyltransferase Ste14